MNKSASLFLAVLAIAVGFCLAQTIESQESYLASNTFTCAQGSVASLEVIKPYEVTFTVDDLLFGGGSSITLEKGKDLIIHITNPDNRWHNAGQFFTNSQSGTGDFIGMHVENSNSSGIEAYDDIQTHANISCQVMNIDWGGYDDFLSQSDPIVLDEKSGKEGILISYYFKNNHSGRVQLQFRFDWIPAGNNKGDSWDACEAQGRATSRIIQVRIK